MKSIVLLALLLIGCNSNTKQDETKEETQTDAVYDSVSGSFEFADTLDSAMTDSSFAPHYIRLLIMGSNEDSAKLYIKFTDAGAIPPQMKRTVAITGVGEYNISFTTESKDFVELARKYGSVRHAITSDYPQYILFVDARFDLVEVSEYLKHEAEKRNKGLHHD